MINLDDCLLDQLTEAQMWLLLHVVKRINADGECWPSTGTIQKETKWSDVKKVRRVRDELVQMGILEAYERKRDDGGQTSNLYRINTEMVGVYVSAKRLQNLTRGEGKNLTRGVGKKDTRGEGKEITLANEVLINEVLTIEPTHTQSASDEKLSLQWGEGSEDRAERAIELVASHLKENPNKWGHLCDEARVQLDKARFYDELKAWIRHNADTYPVIQNPVKALTSGQKNFISWLRNVKQFIAKAGAYKPTEQPAPKPNFHKPKRKERVQMTPEEIAQLKAKHQFQ